MFSINHTVIVLGGANDSSALAIAEAATPLSATSKALLDLPLRQVMVVLKGASLVIGNDTGLLHMADALAIKSIVIEGPTHAYLGFSTYRETSMIVGESLWCRPCSKTGNICWRWNSRACLNDITAARVNAVAQTQMQRATQ
jgi:ADP-heptose:LPS heptosyltransferase